MAQQKVTKRNIRIAADLDAALVKHMDDERIAKGRCSRAAIIRMALLDRYKPTMRAVNS